MNDIQQLPIYAVKRDCQNAIASGAAVITAPTGSGKSTQIPKFILEMVGEKEKILVLQPRRLAARMLAERIAQEMGTPLGKLVGFQTRYEHVASAETRILFITEGILTRMLVADHTLNGVAAIVFDEFHERSLNTDLGLAMARHVQQNVRNDLRIVVMSATMDAAPVSAYLGNCPIVNSDGRLFDVSISYISHQEQMEGVAVAACKGLRKILDSGSAGDVLIFMPGGFEIRKTIETCRSIHGGEQFELLPLYGELPPEAQRQVMLPAAHRKVIVATNIAETSLTIPGVRHVIDSGLVRVSRYDATRGVDMLDTMPIALDAAVQRAGRAGREAPGTCMRLWTQIEHNTKQPRTSPEIFRVDLIEAVLAVIAFGFNNPAEFPWFDTPSENRLDSARILLEELGYVKRGFGGLTELGKKLHLFPAHPRLTLLMWNGAENGCFKYAAWAAAIISERPLITAGSSPRAVSRERRTAAKQKAGENIPASDFLTQIELAIAARNSHFAMDFCQSVGVNAGAARDICRAAEDYITWGKRIGWCKESEANDQLSFLKCILRAFPDRLAKRRDMGTLVCIMQGGKFAELVRESVVRDEPLFIAAEMRKVAASGVQSSKLALSLASGIREDWLLDMFPDEWEDIDETYWDEKRQQVLRRQSLACLGVVLDEKVRNEVDADKAAAILAEQINRNRMPIPGWDENVERWIERVRWTASIFPEQNLPLYDDADKDKVIKMFCYGETSIKGLRNKDCLATVKQLLTYSQQAFVEAMAPAHIQLPNGRRMKIEYSPGQTPKGRSKIQDFYDMTQTPSVAGGKIRILLDILAPNMRTVQITDDLPNFWNILYPKIRTELARRYPKHQWR